MKTAADLTAALRTYVPHADLTVKATRRPGEFTAVMPAVSAQRLGVFDADGGGYAGLRISGALGEAIHITASRGLRYDTRYGARTEVTMRLHAAEFDDAFALLAAAGYSKDTAVAMLEEATQFPGRYAYAPDRRRCTVYHMPGGRREVFDCAESEARISSYRERRGSMLRARPEGR